MVKIIFGADSSDTTVARLSLDGRPLLVEVPAVPAAAVIVLSPVECIWLGIVVTVAGDMAGLQILLLLELVVVVEVVVIKFSVVKILAGCLLGLKNSASICTSSSSSKIEARLLCNDCKSIDSILDSAVGVQGEVTRAALFLAQVESMRCLK